MSDTDRLIRQIQNAKGNHIAEGSQRGVMAHTPSRYNMSEGEQVFAQEANKPLALYKKNKGMLHKVNLSSDGNQYVEKTLTAEELKFTKRFTTYKIIAHNMEDDIGTSEVFLPWFGILEGSDLTSVSSSFLVPYSMTLKKIMFRPSAISTGSYDLVVRLKKMDDGDAVVDTVATATWDVSDAAFDDLAAATFISVERSHFDNNPKFEIGDNCGVSIQSATGDYGGSIKWKITSVWAVEITI